MFHGVECLILEVVAIFDNTSNGVFSQNFNMSGDEVHGGDGMKKSLRTHLKVFHIEYTGECKNLLLQAT